MPSCSCARRERTMLGRIGQAERHEQQTGLVDVAVVAVDHDDLDLVAARTAQSVGGQGAAGSGAEDDDAASHVPSVAGGGQGSSGIRPGGGAGLPHDDRASVLLISCTVVMSRDERRHHHPSMIGALAFGLLIGLILGMVGGGGAVLAVPALVYAVGLDVHAATTASLAVVAAGAATGAVGQARRGAVCWSSAAWFAVAASAGSIVGTVANRALGGSALLLLFSCRDAARRARHLAARGLAGVRGRRLSRGARRRPAPRRAPGRRAHAVWSAWAAASSSSPRWRSA